jgi:hypothetical protein
LAATVAVELDNTDLASIDIVAETLIKNHPGLNSSATL